jgi:D-serine deaminase-like pyridoxal phosphate-dependent protein
VVLAGLQRDAGAYGIAVAKVGEAEVYAQAGFDDIAIAYPVVGAAKWRRVAHLATTVRTTVNVDSAVAAEGLSAAAVGWSRSRCRSTSTAASAAAACRSTTRAPSRPWHG